MTFDAFETYKQWCLDHHRKPPTRAWWDKAVAKGNERGDKFHAPLTAMARQAKLDQAEIDREKREGWA